MLFTYDIKKQNEISIITLAGDLIESNEAGKLMTEIDQLILNNEIRFIIDMGTVKYLNSTGLTILIRILTKARKAGGEAIITSVGKRVKELLVITKLNTVFTVTETIEEGINKLK